MRKPRINNYIISIMLSMLGSVGLAVALAILSMLGLGELAAWESAFIYGTEMFLLISQVMSGNGYFFQLIDKFTKEKTVFHLIRHGFHAVQKQPTLAITSKKDTVFIGLIIGVIGAAALTALDIIAGVFPFAQFGKSLSTAILVIGNLSLCGGLGNRLGHVAYYLKNSEKLGTSNEFNYVHAVAVGFLIGAIIVSLTLAFCGLTAFTGGSVLGIVVYAAGMIGSSGSAAGYIGRACDFLRMPTPKLESIQTQPYHEKKLTYVGLIIGLGVAVTLIALGLITLPVFGSGIPKLALGIMMFITLVSAGGGAGNRLGTAIDAISVRVKNTEHPDEKSIEPPKNNNGSSYQKIGVSLPPRENTQQKQLQSALTHDNSNVLTRIYRYFFKPARLINMENLGQQGSINFKDSANVDPSHIDGSTNQVNYQRKRME